MKRTITPIDRLLTAEALADALAPVAADYAATLDATAELPATDRQRARQKRRGLYLRLLRQTLRTVALLKEDR
jgi:hypothetical protein